MNTQRTHYLEDVWPLMVAGWSQGAAPFRRAWVRRAAMLQKAVQAPLARRRPAPTRDAFLHAFITGLGRGL